MRISTSPMTIQSKMVQKVNQFPQNLRSSSLSNSSLFSSKIHHPMQNNYFLQNYNQNSGVRLVSNQDYQYQQRPKPNVYGPSDITFSIQNNIKKIIQRLQLVQKKLKTQQSDIKTIQKLSQQKLLDTRLQQKIQKQIQQKNLSNYENLFKQIKKIQTQVFKKIQFSAAFSNKNIQSDKKTQINNNKLDDHQNIISQRKNLKMIEQKLKQEVFKLQIHLQNQINKTLQGLKNRSQINLLQFNNKSNLRYKYKPLEISIKNQVSVVKNTQDSRKINPEINKNNSDLNIKRKKENLSTTHSSESSQQNQLFSNTKIIQIEEHKYFIDKEGYLLDQNGFYILNQDDKMIRIDRNLIKKLRQHKMIQ